MKRCFLDTNLLLDVLLDRRPFSEPAQLIWTLADRQRIQAAVSAISLNNIFFIVRKLASPTAAYTAVRTVMDIFTTVEVNDAVLRKALAYNFPDFEDAVQYASALRYRAQVILSRDPTGFSAGRLPVLDAAQYLVTFDGPS